MATVEEMIRSARYDLHDETEKNYSWWMMLDYGNRGLRGLITTLTATNSDWVNTTADLRLTQNRNSVSLPKYFISDISARIGSTYLIKKPVSVIRDKRMNTGTGTPNYYGIQGTTLIVEALVTEITTIVLEFHQGVAPLAPGDNMPFNDEFNDILRQFIVIMCKIRNELYLMNDIAIRDFFYQALFSKLVSRNHIPNTIKTEF